MMVFVVHTSCFCESKSKRKGSERNGMRRKKKMRRKRKMRMGGKRKMGRKKKMRRIKERIK